MPSIGDACPSCNEGLISACDPGYCVQCSEGCGFHDDDPEGLEIPFEESVAPAPTPASEVWDYGSLVLPEGVTWNTYPAPGIIGRLWIPQGNSHEYATQLAGLRAWAEENQLALAIYNSQTHNIGAGYQTRPIVFYVGPDATEWASIPHHPWPEDVECVFCGETHPAYTSYCEATNHHIRCAMCLFYRSDIREADGQYLCPNCIHECADSECTEQVYDSVFCEEHGQARACERCDYWIELHVEEDFLQDANGSVLCEDCHSRCCPECGTYQRRELTYSEEHGQYVCRRCLIGGDDAEEFDSEAHAELHIPSIPGRENIRLCGVEIEGGDGTGSGQDLARAFNNAGLSEWDRMGSYHSGSEGGFAHVERDSSVDWEAVIGPVNFANVDDTEALRETVKVIRQLVRDGVLTLDLRAGCHIHVEAARTSLDGAFNLSLLFSYAEDVIFRLAAARWPVHRAIQDTHYTQPIPKELRKVQFARAHAENDSARYFALSFNNYFGQMLSRCRCGATRYDSWEDCTCNLGKCTFEFRVFNTTANPRKLHAYLALCQALVAKALSMGKVEEPASVFPELSFVRRRFKDMDSAAQEELVEAWRERLTWLFTELPLTDDEKASLAYCVRNSELDAVGEEFINTLLPEQQVIEEVTA